MDKKLHIVCFDVPLPANYGGAIDVFYRIRSLHKAGVKLILHCFEYGERRRMDELSAYCDVVYYYKRNTGIQGFSLLRPYIVNSRKSPLLLKRLLETELPILFEGLHCCYYLNHPALKDRKKYVRTHNIEHNYYQSLVRSEKKWWRRMYYQFEANLLKRYEVVLKDAIELYAISENDVTYFSAINKTYLLPAFHGNDVVYSQLGEGKYCLFHGKLSVPENEAAACDLIENVFSRIEHATIIAGANPSKHLEGLIEVYDHIELVANPSDSEMKTLKQNAHIHVLYSAQSTGVKLKLIDSLCTGRFVIANNKMLVDPELKLEAKEVNTWDEYCSIINDLFIDVFTQEHRDRRERLIQTLFSNVQHAEMLINRMFAT